MEYSNFETKFLSQFKSNSSSCIKTIEENEEIIKLNLGPDADPKKMDKFVDEINNILLETKNNVIKNPYKFFRKVLRHPLFDQVLNAINESNILLRACKVGNKNLSKWLLSDMNINPYVQDEDGMFALMYAAQRGYNFIIQAFLYDGPCINLEDKNGNNALFHAVHYPKFITSEGVTNKFVSDFINSKIDINHINHKGETILTYCIKNNIYKPICLYLLHHPNIDVNIADNDGITSAMYLTEKGRYNELLALHRKNCNYDYIDVNGCSTLSILIDKLYSKKNLLASFDSYVRVMSAFVNHQCDFNIPIDKEDNTSFMISLIVKDDLTTNFCAKYLKKLDLSVKNKFGESITSLTFKLGRYDLLDYYKKKSNI